MTDEPRPKVKAIEKMDDETFVKHWRARHAATNRMGMGDGPLSPTNVASLRRYHARLHTPAYFNAPRFGPGDPGHDHGSAE
jgi:hypothetical protein